jgi:hypothetical protein
MTKAERTTGSRAASATSARRFCSALRYRARKSGSVSRDVPATLDSSSVWGM